MIHSVLVSLCLRVAFQWSCFLLRPVQGPLNLWGLLTKSFINTVKIFCFCKWHYTNNLCAFKQTTFTQIQPYFHSLQALKKTGLLTSDPRLRDCIRQMRQSSRDSNGPVMMDKTLFRKWEKALFIYSYICMTFLKGDSAMTCMWNVNSMQISVRMLSKTCLEKGCEVRWGYWSLIHDCGGKKDNIGGQRYLSPRAWQRRAPTAATSQITCKQHSGASEGVNERASFWFSSSTAPIILVDSTEL